MGSGSDLSIAMHNVSGRRVSKRSMIWIDTPKGRRKINTPNREKRYLKSKAKRKLQISCIVQKMADRLNNPEIFGITDEKGLVDYQNYCVDKINDIATQKIDNSRFLDLAQSCGILRNFTEFYEGEA